MGADDADGQGIVISDGSLLEEGKEYYVGFDAGRLLRLAREGKATLVRFGGMDRFGFTQDTHGGVWKFWLPKDNGGLAIVPYAKPDPKWIGKVVRLKSKEEYAIISEVSVPLKRVTALRGASFPMQDFLEMFVWYDPDTGEASPCGIPSTVIPLESDNESEVAVPNVHSGIDADALKQACDAFLTKTL